MKLYELTEQHLELRDIAESGELDQQTIEDTLEGIKGEFDGKAVSVGIVIKEMQADAKAMDDAVKALQQRKKTTDTRIKWLQEYLLRNLEALDIKSISSPVMPIKMVKNPPFVVYTDASLIPELFIEEVISTKIDKKSISEMLKSGEDVPGCELKTSFRVKIG